MTEKGVQLMGLIIGQSWRLFTEWKLPFTNFTPAALFFFMMFVPIMVSVFKAVLGITIDEFLHTGSKRLTNSVSNGSGIRVSGYLETKSIK